jgi:hypothetical protein
MGKALALGSLPDLSAAPLSKEQRIKLAEALIFSIRRRASIHEYCDVLMECMLFGAKQDSSTKIETNDAALIQSQTHDYFLKEVASEENVPDEEDSQKNWDEIDIRVRAGGPLFRSEEDDAVTASKLNVTAELLAVSHPAVVARFTSSVISSAIYALRLDTSRPVRRAGAYLAKQLYSTLLREQDSFDPNAVEQCEIPFAMSLAAGNEDTLRVTLERCFDAADLDDLGTGKQRFYDPATEARCKEALETRKQADVTGILAAGQLALELKRKQTDNPVARLLMKNDPDDAPSSRFKIVELD